MSKTKIDDFNFEKSINELNRLVEEIEQKNSSLKELVEKFKKGMILSEKCQKALKEAEQEVNLLTNQSGNDVLTPFKPESEDGN